MHKCINKKKPVSFTDTGSILIRKDDFKSDDIVHYNISRQEQFVRIKRIFFFDISFLQERKSAKSRAQTDKFSNTRNQAVSEPRAQGRKGAIGVQYLKKLLAKIAALWYNKNNMNKKSR